MEFPKTGYKIFITILIDFIGGFTLEFTHHNFWGVFLDDPIIFNVVFSFLQIYT